MTAIDDGEFAGVLQARFAKNMPRYLGVAWSHVEARLSTQPEKLRAIYTMEQNGDEPDLVVLDAARVGMIFVDCSAENPIGRRSICYDRKALDARKENKPARALERKTRCGS